ncbi:MAG: 2OG-Fe(II) oxygenase [Sphingomicrobium sp.]
MENFLDEAEHSVLLEWVLENRERFRPASVIDEGATVVDPKVRQALTLREFDGELGWLCERFSAVQQRLIDSLRLTVPPIESLEVELAAHGDGAHFAPHLDIPVGAAREPRGGRPKRSDDRLISAVYYFYREPKPFTGGHLRLYPLGSEAKEPNDDAGSYIDVEPTQNTLVAFPSWATHEVREIRCPSGDFADYRFAVNCWYCGQFKSG